MRRSVFAGIVVLAAGCGDAGSGVDAAAPTVDTSLEVDTPTVRDVPATDVVRDAPDASTRPTFAPCTTTTQCGAIPMARCLTVADGYPTGYCTRGCTSDAVCGADGICLPYQNTSLCFRRCDTATDCRAGYQCFTARGTGDTAEHACFPFCSTDAQCPGAACNTYSRFCGTVDTAAADNGAPCTTGTDCRSGRCFTELSAASGDATGYLGGQCYSRCTILPAADYAGPTYPRGECPAHSVCEWGAGQSAGQPGLCRDECTTEADCRPGFICLHHDRGADAGATTNGYCAPMNCHYMAQACPAFATCRTTASDDAGVATSGFCVRTPGSDAGAAPDATPAGDAGRLMDAASDGG